MLLARRALSRIMVIRLEYESMLNIVKASVVMGVLLGGYRLIVPLSNVWVILVAVVGGGVLYGILILKLYRKMCDDLKTIATQMNLYWPRWL